VPVAATPAAGRMASQWAGKWESQIQCKSSVNLHLGEADKELSDILVLTIKKF
jgi:hypothetical protein